MNQMVAGLYKDTTGAKFRNPLRTDVNGRLAAGVGSVFSAGIVTSEPAYAAGDAVGLSVTSQTNYVTLDPVLSEGYQESVLIDSVAMFDPKKLHPNLTILFFSDNPNAVGGGANADNSGFDWGAGLTVPPLFCGKVDILAADWLDIGVGAVATVNHLAVAVTALSGGKLWFIPVIASGAPDWAAGDILRLAFGVRKG